MNIIFVLLITVSGIAGAWYHYIEVTKRSNVGTFIDYFFKDNTDGSKATVIAFLAAMQTLYIAGSFNGLSLSDAIVQITNLQLYTPLLTSLSVAFGAGYGCDSKLNSGITKQP
jgi:hypothetical protein